MSAVENLDRFIRAMAVGDWETVDEQIKRLENLGWEGGSQYIGAAFALLVHRRFDSRLDHARVAQFVRDTQANYEGGARMPALEMEGMIRAALGEDHLIDDMEPEKALSVQVMLLGALLREADLDPAQLDAFMSEVSETAARHM